MSITTNTTLNWEYANRKQWHGLQSLPEKTVDSSPVKNGISMPKTLILYRWLKFLSYPYQSRLSMAAAWISCGTQLQKSSPPVTVMPNGSTVKKIWINVTFRSINCSYYVPMAIPWKKTTNKTVESCNKFLFSTCLPGVRIVKNWHSFPLLWKFLKFTW